MSIQDRAEDAIFLWNAGRKESAISLIFIAFAATARLRYPRPTPDNKAFKKFALDEMGKITGGPSVNVAFPFNGRDKVPLEEILYEIMRCELIHEGTMPKTVYLTPPQFDFRTFRTA